MSPDSAFSLPHSPVAVIGTITLLVAFLVNGYALVAGVAGHRRDRPGLVASALWASWAFSALMCLASALMVYAFVSHDYTIKYVAPYSDTSMPLFYKLTAYWGGLDGSIMFWVWMLSMFSAAALFVNRKRHPEMIGYVIATIAAVATFFLAVILWNKNPFSTFLTAPPVDGKGLNPLLQTYWMAIHPPSLYIGYVGMTIPFAFCVGALASGRLDDAWLGTVRAWVMIPWFFLSFGLTLGGLWAYEELGWGGYWAWDPVENAGLIPWFTATAFLHSSVIQERRGMLRVWNVTLMVITFFLTIFGTFMTRSGVVQSVHAFGQDNELALLFILFMAVILIFSLGLVIYRLPSLRSTAAYESFWSREFAFLLNNWILLACAFFVLFATMFPTLSESVTGQRITVAAPFFNKWMTPLGLALLLLTGIGPLLAWRTTTRRRLWEQLAFPGAVALLTLGAISVFLPRWRVKTAFMSDKLQLPVALICMGLIALTFGSVLQEFWRGTVARRRQTGTDPLTSLVGVVLSKKRKYGGYVVHLAVALMFFGFAGKARSIDKQVTLERQGETFTIRDYTFRYDDVWTRTTEGYHETGAQVTVLNKGGQTVAVMSPSERRYFKGNDEKTSEIAIDRRLDQDIYLVLNAADLETKQANFTAFLNPLVNWVWLGFGLLALGTVLCLIPEWVVEAVRPRRRTAAGRMAEAAVVLAVLLGCTFGLVGMARAQAPPQGGGGGGPAVHEQAPAPGQGAMHVELSKADDIDLDAVPGVAKRLFGDLVCLCGGCPRETLAVCKCGFAAGERKSILDMLAGRDLSNKAAEEAAYEAVKLAYVGKFGGERILANPSSPLSWIVPYAVFGGALIVVVIVGRTWVKRGRAGQVATVPGAATAKRAEYEDRLDDELDRLD